MGGMLPVEIFNLSLGQVGQFGIDVTLVASLVIELLPEEQADTEDEYHGGCSQIEAVSDRVIWSIERKDYEAIDKRQRACLLSHRKAQLTSPGRDESANVTHHDVGSDTSRS